MRDARLAEQRAKVAEEREKSLMAKIRAMEDEAAGISKGMSHNATPDVLMAQSTCRNLIINPFGEKASTRSSTPTVICVTYFCRILILRVVNTGYTVCLNRPDCGHLVRYDGDGEHKCPQGATVARGRGEAKGRD